MMYSFNWPAFSVIIVVQFFSYVVLLEGPEKPGFYVLLPSLFSLGGSVMARSNRTRGVVSGMGVDVMMTTWNQLFMGRGCFGP